MKNKNTYVSLETALLLKDLGFDLEVIGSYDMASHGQFMPSGTCKKWNYNGYNDKYIISAPTIEEASTWFKEKKGINLIEESDNGVFTACQQVLQSMEAKTYRFNELTPDAQNNAIAEACTAYTTFMGPIPSQVYKNDIKQLLQEKGFKFHEDGTPVKEF